MEMKIGENAGKIWRCLQTGGEMSFTQICNKTRLNQRDADRAVGWLAREGKLNIERKGNRKIETFSLKGH